MNVPWSVVNAEYCACPTASFDTSLLVSHCSMASASLPATSISPMWLTSNRPAAVLTARCSLTIPLYSTGMSQPLNSTIRAPWDRCLALSGVFFRLAGELDVMSWWNLPSRLSREPAGPYNVLSPPATVKDARSSHGPPADDGRRRILRPPPVGASVLAVFRAGPDQT